MNLPLLREGEKLLAVVGGVSVLCAGSGAAAVFVGKEKFFGPSYADLNGLTCSVLQTFTTKRDGRTWVRRCCPLDPVCRTSQSPTRVYASGRVPGHDGQREAKHDRLLSSSPRASGWAIWISA